MEASQNRCDVVLHMQIDVDLISAWLRDGDVARRAFLQQQLRRLDARLAVEAPAHNIVVENIVDRDQRHALMMCHVGFYDSYILTLRHALASEIQGLVKTIGPASAQRFEAR